MSDTAHGVPVSPFRSAFHSERVEQRNTGHGSGTEQRNTSGTADLLTLANRVLSRRPSGTPSGTAAEQRPEKPFRPPRNTPVEAPTRNPCPHVDQEWLRKWYTENPQVVCARCFLAGRPLPAWDREGARRLLADTLGRCESAYKEVPAPAVFGAESVRVAERRIDSAFRAQDRPAFLRALRVYERAFVRALEAPSAAPRPSTTGLPTSTPPGTRSRRHD